MNELLREILFNLPLYDTVLQKLLAGDLYEGFPKSLVLTQVQIFVECTERPEIWIFVEQSSSS